MGAVAATPVLAPPPPPARPWSAPTCRVPVAVLRGASSPQTPCSALSLPTLTGKCSPEPSAPTLGYVSVSSLSCPTAHQPLPTPPSLQASWPKAPTLVVPAVFTSKLSSPLLLAAPSQLIILELLPNCYYWYLSKACSLSRSLLSLGSSCTRFCVLAMYPSALLSPITAITDLTATASFHHLLQRCP